MSQNENLFESSDSVRSGSVLKHVRTVTLSEPFELENGGELPEVTVAFETYGQLNPNRDNAVLVCHALTGDSHIARHDENDDAGWWDIVVGPGKPIDTDRYFVICPNALGGCRGTTGPNSINPKTGKPYGADFPVITVGRYRSCAKAGGRPLRNRTTFRRCRRLTRWPHGDAVGRALSRDDARYRCLG